MNVLLSLNEKNVNYYLVTLLSLFKNNEGAIQIYCLYMNEDKRAFALLRNITKKYDNTIFFIKVNNQEDRKLFFQKEEEKKHWFRNILKTFPKTMERIIYLESDVIVNGDITDFYKTDFENKYMVVRGQTYKQIQENYHRIGARPEKGQYFDSRVLLINLLIFRSDFDAEKELQILNEYDKETIQSFQGLLNVIFNEKVKYESRLKYNYRFSIYEQCALAREDINGEIPIIICFERRDYYNIGITVVPWEIRLNESEIKTLKEHGIIKKKYDLQLMETISHQMIELWWNYAEKTEIYKILCLQMLRSREELLKNVRKTETQIQDYIRKTAVLASIGYDKSKVDSKWFYSIKYRELEEYIDSVSKDTAIQVMKSLFHKNCYQLSHKSKIRVGFIVYSSSEWQCEELYKKFSVSEKFFPSILVARYSYGNCEIIEEKYRETCQYFENKNYDICYGDKKSGNGKRGLDAIEEFDILIYFTPFDLVTEEWNILERPIRQLCIHIPYAYYLVNKDDVGYSDIYYDKPIFQLTWFYFASCELQAEIVRQRQRLQGYNIKVSGFPKVDTLLEKKYTVREDLWKINKKSKIKIIWAPHFNMRKGMNGTFHYNYVWFWEFAKNNPEISWIVRPHPRMERGVLEKGIFQTTDEYKQYLEKWNDLPNARVIPNGEYYDIFAFSDAMILDSVSFLAEYQFTEKPLLLLQPECKRTLSELGERLVSVLYTANGKDFKKIEEFLKNVELGIDLKKTERKNFLNEYLDYVKINKKTATEYIYDVIFKDIFGE